MRNELAQIKVSLSAQYEAASTPAQTSQTDKIAELDNQLTTPNSAFSHQRKLQTLELGEKVSILLVAYYLLTTACNRKTNFAAAAW